MPNSDPSTIGPHNTIFDRLYDIPDVKPDILSLSPRRRSAILNGYRRIFKEFMHWQMRDDSSIFSDAIRQNHFFPPIRTKFDRMFDGELFKAPSRICLNALPLITMHDRLRADAESFMEASYCFVLGAINFAEINFAASILRPGETPLSPMKHDILMPTLISGISEYAMRSSIKIAYMKFSRFIELLTFLFSYRLVENVDCTPFWNNIVDYSIAIHNNSFNPGFLSSARTQITRNRLMFEYQHRNCEKSFLTKEHLIELLTANYFTRKSLSTIKSLIVNKKDK